MAERGIPCDEGGEVDQGFDCHCSTEVYRLLPEMHAIYVHHAATIENDENLSESQKLRYLNHALRAYVGIIRDLNREVSSSVVLMEVECRKRVDQMELKLKRTAKNTREAVVNMAAYEKEAKRVFEEKLHLESLYTDLNQKYYTLESENSFLQDQNSNLRHDIQSLLQVIQHARSTGHWELDCVTFCELSPESVFGPIQSISQGNSVCVIESYYSTNPEGKENFSPVPYYPPDLYRCSSLPEIGNIYDVDQAMYKSSSYNGKQRLFEVKYSKGKGYGTTLQTPEQLKIVSCGKSMEERVFAAKSQSEPNLFMFDGQIYKYTPCEPFQKPSSNVLNDNYPTHQSIDLRFPTEGSTLKTNGWNNLKSGSYLDDQENSYLKDEVMNSSSSFSEDSVQMSSVRSSDINSDGERVTSPTDHGALYNDVVEMYEKMINEKDRRIQELEMKLEEAKQNQKHSDMLLIAVSTDYQTMEDKHNEACNEIQKLKTQMQDQTDVIGALQENLVQTKRALEAAQPKASSSTGKKPKSRITNI